MYDNNVLKEKVELAVKNGRDLNFVSGFMGNMIPMDNSYGRDTHFTALTVEVYHQFAKAHPELNLGDRLTAQIQNSLKTQRVDMLPYLIFKVMDEEIKIEKTNKAGFKMDPEEVRSILAKLRSQIENLADAYKSDKTRDGQGYADGIYGYLSNRGQAIEQSTGFKF